MAIKAVKKMIEDLENNTSLVLGDITKEVSTAAYAGTAGFATTAATAGATTSGSSGTSGTSP